MEKNVYLVKAFTKDKTQGNPAGVLLDADGLTDTQMISISADLGFSESAFIQQSTVADFRVRFFSSKNEVPFCGHATIATFHTLVELGMLTFNGKKELKITQETQAGILPVFCHKDGFIIMGQNEPEFGSIESDRTLIAKLLSISPDEILPRPIQSVSTASSKLIIPVASLAVLQKIKPDLAGISAYSERTGVRGMYPFTTETIDPDSDFHARQFNPLIGINEDPITGIAAGALVSYIVKHGLSTKKSFVIEQGYGMNKGGKMYVDVAEGVRVGGYAVTFGHKNYDV